MINAGDIERSEKVFNELGEKLAESYHPGQFTIHALSQAQGWVRNGTPVYVKHTGKFLLAQVYPPKAPPYRFMILREDAWDIDTHAIVLMFIKLQNFPDYERTDGRRCYYQLIPPVGDSPGELKEWEAGAFITE